MDSPYSREGYLKENFRLFHLCDTAGQERDYHYHEFDKIVLFLSGHVNYIVEGTTYALKPWDILLINHHLIHKALIDTQEPYERVIIYINTAFVEANSGENENLMKCFQIAEKRNFYMMRPEKHEIESLQRLFERLERALHAQNFGKEAEAKALFVLLLIYLNRMILQDTTDREEAVYEHDAKIAETLSYINDHIAQDLTVEELAGRVFLSKYYFMRRFRECTGYTVHHYIQQKRLLLAVQFIRSGMPFMQAAAKCGFHDYSSFSRAFKKTFHVAPGRFR